MSEKAKETDGIVLLGDLFEVNPFAVPPVKDSENVQISDKIEMLEPDTKVEETEDKLGDFLSDTTTVKPEREEQEERKEELVVVEDYKKVLAKSLSSLGIETIVIEEDGKEVEKNITDLDLTEELHNQILQDFIAQQKEEVSKNKISIEGTSEFLQKLIEVESKGGRISDLLQQKLETVDPVMQFDTSTEEGQVQVINMYLSANGKDSEEIEALLTLWKTKGILESKAEEVKERVQEDLEKAIVKEQERAETVKKEREDFLKNYKKDFKGSLTSFELNEPTKQKLTDFATKVVDIKLPDGRVKKNYLLDEELGKIRLSPEKAARLALFVFDEEEYIKQVTNKKVVEEKLKTGTKIGTVKLRKSGSTDEFSLTKVKDDADFAPL
jgi:hypothetical protein